MKGLKRAVGVLAVAGAAAFATGCSGGDGDSSAPPPTSPPATSAPAPSQAPAAAPPAARPSLAAEAQRLMNDCLRKAGIKPSPSNFEKLSQQQQAAAQRCGLEVLKKYTSPSPR